MERKDVKEAVVQATDLKNPNGSEKRFDTNLTRHSMNKLAEALGVERKMEKSNKEK